MLKDFLDSELGDLLRVIIGLGVVMIAFILFDKLVTYLGAL